MTNGGPGRVARRAINERGCGVEWAGSAIRLRSVTKQAPRAPRDTSYAIGHLQEDLMRLFVGESDDLVLNGWAVPGPIGREPPAVLGSFVEVVSNELVRLRRGARDVARQLGAPGDTARGAWGCEGWRQGGCCYKQPGGEQVGKVRRAVGERR